MWEGKEGGKLVICVADELAHRFQLLSRSVHVSAALLFIVALTVVNPSEIANVDEHAEGREIGDGNVLGVGCEAGATSWRSDWKFGGEGDDHISVAGVPKADSAIEGAGAYALAVAAEVDAGDGVSMGGDGAGIVAGLRVPEAKGLIFAATGAYATGR